MSTAAPARPRHELLAWRNAMFLIFFLCGLAVASWVARTPAIKDGLDISLGQVGILIFGASAGSVVGLIAAPALLARLGARRAMLTAIVAISLGMVVLGLGVSTFSSFAIAYIGMIVFGFGNGALDVNMNVEAAAAERELAKTVMPLMHAFFSFGTVAGAGLAALAVFVGLDVAVHLSIIAVLIAITGVVAIRYVPHRVALGDDASVEEKRHWTTKVRQNFAVWKDVRLILIGVVMLGMAFAEGSANDWLALAVRDGHGQTDAIAAVLFGIFVTSMTITRVIGGPLLDRFGRVIVLQVLAALGIVGLLMFILGTELWVVIIGIVLWGAGVSLGFPVGMSAAADDEKNSAARVSAVAIIGYCAFLVGPPLIGFLGQHFGILNALYLLLVLMVLAAVCAPATREKNRRR